MSTAVRSAGSAFRGSGRRPYRHAPVVLVGLVTALLLAAAGTLVAAAGYDTGPAAPPPRAIDVGGIHYPPPGSHATVGGHGRLAAASRGGGSRTVAAPGASPPTRVEVPRIGVDARVVRIGMTGSGVLRGPRTGHVAGWFTGSPTPGQRGAAVLAGHVDWTDGPAVFYRLGVLRPGDAIRVTRSDGRVASFAVHAVRQYSKNDFPGPVVYGRTPGPQLRLITCGGPFAAGHYQDNVVIFAHLTSVRPATARTDGRR